MKVKQLQTEINDRAERFSSMSDGELLVVISQSRDLVLEAIMDFCVAYVEAEKRKLDLDEMRPIVPKYYARIASGNVSVRAWIRFGEYPMLMDKIATLPLDDQERLADGERIQMVVHGSGMGYDPRRHVMIDPLQITPEQIRYVFADGAIRDIKAQAAWADTLAAREPKESRFKLVLTLEEELDDKLSQLASNEGMSKKEYVRRLIRRAK